MNNEELRMKNFLSPMGEGAVVGVSRTNAGEGLLNRQTSAPTSFLPLKGGSRIAFTLAEVLITLGVIGVVAAMTMPTLIAKYREKATVTAVKEAYSIFSQAYLQVLNEHGNLTYLVDTTKNAKENAVIMFRELSKYIKKVKSCDVENTNCMGNEIYENLNGQRLPKLWDEYSNLQTGILSNGMTFWVVSGIDSNNNEKNHYSGQVAVDINGNKKPNQLGVDFFIFRVDGGGRVSPTGSEYDCSIAPNPCPDNNRFYRCNIDNEDNNNTYNGYACTAWILEHENMDYLKRNVSE